MTNNLHNIVVYIKDEAMLQEAREILERYGQSYKLLMQYEMLSFNFLQLDYFDKIWFLSNKVKSQKEITLAELQQLLKQNRDETTTTR